MKENKSTPDCLYHYTNINSLALILKYKTLKLNCLANVDDLNEGISSDLGKVGKYFFVSCWTDKREESIPFWSMYTDDMSGVRIKLPINPFKTYSLPEEKIEKAPFNQNISIHRPEQLFDNKYMPAIEKNILKKVEYTNDENLLFPNIFERDDSNQPSINLNKIGIYKREEWSFQSEWRYIVKILPMSFKEITKFDSQFGIILYKAICSGRPIPLNEYYLDLDEEKIRNMEITLGPKISDGGKIIVKSLVNKFDINAEIYESSLIGQIRYI
ncbi:MAG: DUF2971 domain-containing protein [Halanaerobiales bacterium]